MNGYFGALMRSSGLTVGAAAAPLAHADAGVVELERRAASVPPVAEPAALPPTRAALARTPVIHPPGPVPTPLDPRTTDDVPMVDARPAAPPRGEPGADATARTDPPLAASTGPGPHPPKPAPGEVLVRAAMKWVAADPVHAHGVAPSAAPAVTPQARMREPAQPLRDPRVEPGTREPAAPPRLAAPSAPIAREPVPRPALAMGPARSDPIAPPEPIAPIARDEVVDVSIGAIHVRVDAAAAQTVARPAPAPPAPPRAATPAPRSALSRRALRRI